MTISKLDLQAIKTLSGHSGCSVQLYLVGDMYFVRKTSASPEYNARLKRQIGKQVALSRTLLTPEIYDEGEKDGLLFFDMEFVRGHGFVSFAPLQSLNGICSIVERLTNAIQLLSHTASGWLDPMLFTDKIESLTRQILDSKYYALHEPFLRNMLNRLIYCDWSEIPQSLCHGDLTVENMLLTDDSIVFIDFLDGDLESVWMDIAKLLQDLRSGWSLRSLLWAEKTEASGRLLQTVTHYLADEIDTQIKSVLPTIIGRLGPLRAVQALRVLPYVTDAKTFSHVVRGLAAIEFEKVYA